MRHLLLDPPANPLLFLAPLSGSLAFQERNNPASRAHAAPKLGTLTGSGAVRYQAASGARINLTYNPRFASNTTGWTAASGTSLTRVTDNVFSGGYAGEIVANTANQGVYQRETYKCRAVVGQTYTFSFDAYLVSGESSWQLRHYEVNASGSVIGGNSLLDGSVVLTADVTRISYQVTVSRAGTEGITLFLWQATGASTIRFSNVVVELGALTADQAKYFDGSTVPGVSAWLDPITGILGTAHASPSVSAAAAWVEEGETNVVADPVFGNATITNFWGKNDASGSCTIAHDTAFAFMGSRSCKLTMGASANDQLAQANSYGVAVNGETWTIIASIRANSAGDVGKKVRLAVSERDAGGTFIKDNTSTDFTLTDSWQTAVYTVTLSGGGTVARVLGKVYNGSTAAACVVNVDCVMLTKKAYATSFSPAVDTSNTIVTGYSWSGTAHASSSTRAGASNTTSEVGRIDSRKGSIFMRFRREIDNGTFQRLIVVGDTAANTHFMTIRISTNDKLEIGFQEGTSGFVSIASADNVTVGAWHTVYAEWNETAYRLIYDGAAIVSGARQQPASQFTSASYDLAIGSHNTSAIQQADCLIGPVAIYDQELRASELAKVRALAERNDLRWDSVLRAA